ncbi:MAG: hypothetical protein H0X23_03910 [Rubrobacter sp.]|nr:hypothetical protein [Rubrobacter sp.]
MGWRHTPSSYLLLLAAVVAGALAFHAWRRRHDAPGAKSLAAFLIAVCWWEAGYALEFGAGDLQAEDLLGQSRVSGHRPGSALLAGVRTPVHWQGEVVDVSQLHPTGRTVARYFGTRLHQRGAQPDMDPHGARLS